MKEFAKLFDETIQELGVTMYQISVRTGIDTATLSRFRQAPRERSVQTLQQILKVLPCSRQTERALYMALFRELLEKEDGKEAWDCMQAVRDLLSIQFSTASLGGVKNPQSDLEAAPELLKGRTIVRNIVLTMLYHTVEKDMTDVCLWGNASPDLLYDITAAFHNTDTKLPHFTTLLAGDRKESGLHNLRLLKDMMPCFCANFSYDARVSYADNMSREMDSPFECLLMTKEVALWIDKNYERAQLVRNLDVIEYYHQTFEEHYKNGERILQRSLDIAEWQQVAHTVEAAGEECHCINWQMCVLELLPISVLQKYMRGDQQMLMTALSFYKSRIAMINAKKERSEYISLAGIQYFVKTGKILEIPENWYDPASMEDRYFAVESLLKIIREENEREKEAGILLAGEEGVPLIQILDEHSFNIPVGMTMLASCQTASYLSYPGYDGKPVNFSFQETGITKWMFKFLKFLPKSGWVYPLETQVQLLEDILQQIDWQIKNDNKDVK